MMGPLEAQENLFCQFRIKEHVPQDLLRRIDWLLDSDAIRTELAALYSHMGRPCVDPELMLRMLLIGYLYGVRSERRLVEEVHLNLAYRWFCKLGLESRVPDRSTFSKNRQRQSIREMRHSWQYDESRRRRKEVEMLFAYLKRHLGLKRFRLRGLKRANEEFLLAATAQNLKRLAKMVLC